MCALFRIYIIGKLLSFTYKREKKGKKSRKNNLFFLRHLFIT